MGHFQLPFVDYSVFDSIFSLGKSDSDRPWFNLWQMVSTYLCMVTYS